MHTAIYARYSSSLQSPTSIEDQERICREYAQRHGLTVAEVYADREISGSVADRPAYQAMMAAAKRGEFEAIICEAQDRLWRDQAEMHSALKRLGFQGVKVLPVATGTDLTSETGRILATVSGLQAETFLGELAKKTWRGMAGTIARGFSAGGAPYGYRSEPTSTDSTGRPREFRKFVQQPEVPMVLRIFEEYAAGSGENAIAKRLNAEHISPPRPKKGRKAQGWDPHTIRSMLRNEIYTGVVYWNRSRKVRDPITDKRTMRRRPKAEWQRVGRPELRIINDALWRRVQARIEAVTKRSGGETGGRRRFAYLFSGLLRCGKCGGGYVTRDKTYSVCGFHRQRGPEVCDNSRVVRRDLLEARLLEAVQQEVFSPQNVAYLTRQVEKALTRRNSQGLAVRRAAEADLRGAEAELENIKSAIRRGIVTETTKTMLEEAEAKIQRLRTETATVPKAATVRLLPGAIKKYVSNLQALLATDTERARGMLEKLLGQVVLYPEGEGLVAELRGNLVPILEAAGLSGGAGRGI